MRNMLAECSLNDYRGSQIMNLCIVTCFSTLTVSYTMYIILLFFREFFMFSENKNGKTKKKAGKMFYHKKKQMKN